MRKALALFATIVCASLCWGQSMTSQKNQYANNGWNKPTVDSSFNHCTTATESQFCWIAIPGIESSVFVSQAHVLALDSSGCAWLYTDAPTNTWAKQTAWGCGLHSIQYDGHNLAWSLRGDTYCTNGNYRLEYYGTDGTPGWRVARTGGAPVCGIQFSTALDGSGEFSIVDASGTYYGSSDYGQTWGNLGSGYKQVVSVDYRDASNYELLMIYSNGTVHRLLNNNWSQLGTLNSAEQIGVGREGNIYALSTDGTVYHWNTASKSWDHLTGNGFSSLAVGDGMNIWTTGATANGANVYRFWDSGLMFTHSYGGSVSCGPGVPQAECETFTHQVNHQICFGSHCGPVAQSSWNGQGGWGPDARVFATPQDLWTCLLAGEPAGPCGLAENEASMECSGGGSNTDGAPSPSIEAEMAHTKDEATGAPSCGYSTDLVYVCTYPVTPGCDNTTTPTFNPLWIDAYNAGGIDADQFLSFDTSALCFDINHGGWFCPISGTVGHADKEYTTFTYSNTCTDTAP